VATAGTKNMLTLAERHGARFAFFSSSEIYGDPDAKHVPTPESYRGNVSAQGPRACYDESKRVGETLCYVFHESKGLATNTIRPFNVYGPGMQETDYRVMPNFASLIKAGRPLHVYGSGNQTRTFCYVTDAMNGFLRVITDGVPGEAYNIGNPKPEISMLDLVKTMEKVLGRKIDHRLMEYPDSYPADEPQRRCPDITKARRQIGFAPKVTLEEGLRRFLGWTDRTYTGNA
jgi:UDP-glucuronate decarboxylase